MTWLDYDRPDYDETSGERHILNFDRITFRIDETDEWCDMPCRTVFDDRGHHFEIGPYSIAGTDALRLVNALSYYGRASGDYRHVTEPGNARTYPLHPSLEPTADEIDETDCD